MRSAAASAVRSMDVEHEFNIFIPLVPAFADAYARALMTDTATDRAVYAFTNHPATPFAAAAVMPQGTWARFRPTRDVADQLVIERRVAAGATEHRLSAGRLPRAHRAHRPHHLHHGAVRARGPAAPRRSRDRPRGRGHDRVTRNGIREVANNYRNARYASNNVTLFAGDEVRVGERLRLDAGVRYERQTALVRVERVGRFTLGPALAERNVAWGTGTFVRRPVSFHDVGVSLGVNYALSGVLNAYGAGSKGYGFRRPRADRSDPRLAPGVNPVQFPFLNARPVLPRRVRVDVTYNF